MPTIIRLLRKAIYPLVIISIWGGNFFCFARNWQDLWKNLSQENLLPEYQQTQNRITLAEKLSYLLENIFSGKIIVTEEQQKDISFLIDEFRDELFLVEQKHRLVNQQKTLTRIFATRPSASGRFTWRGENYSQHPEIDNYPRLYQDIYLEFGSANKLLFNLGMRTTGSALNYISGMRLAIDEASVFVSPVKNIQITLGRIYFVLDTLGLIADNYFDALEGVRLDASWPILNFSFIYSRLSSTNYPFSTIMIDFDDYSAFRLSKKLRKSEIGLTGLISGIGSESAVAVDFYTTFREKEIITEIAAYLPSETNYLLTERHPRLAIASGLDLYRSTRFNIFLQAGWIQNGFTPMASSLLYSAGNHLYFDQNTTGLDLTFTYRPRPKNVSRKSTQPWQTHLDRTGQVPFFTLYELELVGLYRTEELDPNQYRFILRHSRGLSENLYLYLENTFFVQVNTLNYPNTQYNKFLLALVYNF